MPNSKIKRTGLALLCLLVQIICNENKHIEVHKKRRRSKPKEAPSKKYEHAYHSTEEEHRTAEEYQWRWDGRTSRVIATLTLIAVIFTFLTMRDGHETLRQATRQSDSSENQTSILHDQEVQQLRAYVSTDTINRPILVEGLSMYGSVLVQNSGATPASNVMFSGQIRIVSSDDIDAVNHIDFGEIPFSLGSIFPQKSKIGNMSVVKQVNKTDIDDYNAGSKYILVFGTVTYTDNFHSAFRYTNFCWYYGHADEATGQANYCAVHNDSQ